MLAYALLLLCVLLDGTFPTNLAAATAAARHFGIYDDAKELLQSADTNGDGMIDYAEFSWLLRNQNENLKASARAEAKGQLSKFI